MKMILKISELILDAGLVQIGVLYEHWYFETARINPIHALGLVVLRSDTITKGY